MNDEEKQITSVQSEECYHVIGYMINVIMSGTNLDKQYSLPIYYLLKFVNDCLLIAKNNRSIQCIYII